MIKIGLTGNIGSGKTWVCGIFEALGIPIYYADLEARNILNNPKTTAKIREVFGATIFNQEQKIDRKKLAAIVFSHASELQKLNNIIHPQLRINFLTWTEKQTSKYVIQEAAILFENGFHSIMDKTICVSADKKLRLERVMQRDEATKEEVLARMAHQWSDKKKEELADFIIRNNEQEMILPQIINIHQQLLK